MGDCVGDGQPRELPVNEVSIINPFFIGQRPVTQIHWSAIMNNNPSKFQDGWSSGLKPVETVSWYDCIDFIDILNELHKDEQHLSLPGFWRLPTESEWEYCARSGTTTKWSFGNFDGDLDQYGWHAGNAGASTREVGLKKPNNWDLFDMNGLVYEWCQDNFSKDYSTPPSQNAYVDSSGLYVHRGGNWFTESDATRSSARSYSLGSKMSDGIGFRLVWEPL